MKEEFETFVPPSTADPVYVERQPETDEEREFVAAVREADIADGENPDEWGNGLGTERIGGELFTPEEEAKMSDFIAKTEAATEFIPEGEPIPYDAGKEGLLFESEQSEEMCACGGRKTEHAHISKSHWGGCLDPDCKKCRAGTAKNGGRGGIDYCLSYTPALTAEEAATDPTPASVGDILRSIPELPTDLTIPTEINGLAIHHGKILTKEEIKRILDGYRNELEVFGSPYDETLRQLEALGEANWTKADVEQAADIVRYYQKHRIATEGHRKTLKEKSLRTGQFIDGAANIVKAHCENREERAKAIVQHEQRKAALKRALLTEARELALVPFVESVKTYDVGNLSEEAFQAVLAGAKQASEGAQAAKAEADRIAAVELQKREAENAAAKSKLARVNDLSRLGLTVICNDVATEGWEFQNAIRPVIVLDAAIEELDADEWANMLAATEAEVTQIRSQQAEADREAAAARAEIARKAEEERRLAAAPDKEKLLALASDVREIGLRDLTTTASSASRKIEIEAQNRIKALADEIKAQAEAL